MTALPGPIARLNFGGSLAGPDEWSCSMVLAGTTSSPALLTSADGFMAPLTDWFGRVESRIARGATLEYVKFNLINKSDGKYTNQGQTLESIFTPAVQSPQANAYTLNQGTQCITLHTELARGRASKGRFYPPTGTVNVSGLSYLIADGRMDTAPTQQMADSAQELLSEINAAGSSFKVVVWSQLAQIAEPVERVSVGRVVDTQRRRRNSLDEDRKFAAANV